VSKPVIHQVLIGASDGDAITQMALAVRDALRPYAESEIYARWRLSDRMEYECCDLNEYPHSNDVDLTVYHSSIGREEVTQFLRQRSERFAVSYHNITPAEMYRDFNPEFAADLEQGRQDLNELRDRVVLTVADSEYNARDIAQHGYNDVHVVPAGFVPSRLANEEYDVHVLNDMACRFPNGYVVAVGQILPHKRIDQLMETMHILNSTYWGNIGLVVCGVARQADYWNVINKFRNRCAMVDVYFAGSVTDQQLSTYMRGARAYLGMSDHEGLSIPPIEAMSMGVPVVVKGAAAVPETVGNGALVLPETAGPVLAAEAIHEVLHNNELRWSLIHRGLGRAAELESRAPSQRTAELLLAAVR
jgi:glycosyltransferase involved in cell wall biosynthesis